jgi:hypothetical protein
MMMMMMMMMMESASQVEKPKETEDGRLLDDLLRYSRYQITYL